MNASYAVFRSPSYSHESENTHARSREQQKQKRARRIPVPHALVDGLRRPSRCTVVALEPRHDGEEMHREESVKNCCFLRCGGGQYHYSPPTLPCVPPHPTDNTTRATRLNTWYSTNMKEKGRERETPEQNHGHTTVSLSSKRTKTIIKDISEQRTVGEWTARDPLRARLWRATRFDR